MNNLELEYIDADSLLEGKYDRPLYDKFIEAYQVDNLQVLTPNGYVDIEGIGKTIQYDEWRFVTSGGKNLICADTHLVYRCDNMNFDNKKCDLTEIYCKNIQLGDFIMTKDGPEMIMELGLTGNRSHMYDLQLSEGSNKQYYTNDILSHNSLWMQNFAYKSADMGINVLYITLEMSERKVMKRIGAMRLRIPINDYDVMSKDTEMIKKRIQNLSKPDGSGADLFERKVGKIYTKFWAAGTATVNDFDNYIQKLKEKKDIKIDLVIVDYITLVTAGKVAAADNLYTKGKFLAEALRALGAKYKCPVITGVQVAKDAWNSADITLESVPESKAIAETADTFFAIIRTEEMKRQNIYRFKLLKQRDGDFLKSQIKLNLNSTYLTLENDQFIDQ
jgi:DnaB-like helicase C terminal domain